MNVQKKVTGTDENTEKKSESMSTKQKAKALAREKAKKLAREKVEQKKKQKMQSHKHDKLQDDRKPAQTSQPLDTKPKLEAKEPTMTVT